MEKINGINKCVSGCTLQRLTERFCANVIAVSVARIAHITHTNIEHITIIV